MIALAERIPGGYGECVMFDRQGSGFAAVPESKVNTLRSQSLWVRSSQIGNSKPW